MSNEEHATEIAMEWHIRATLVVRVGIYESMEQLQARAKQAMSHVTLTGPIAEGEGTLYLSHEDPIQLAFLNEDEAEAFKQQHQQEEEEKK